ncbi:MAG: 2TM domain-containing protein [Acidobacteriota bacterium]|nr:2TM domain-containing protein [Acidobacteriota bacterium]
MSGLEGSSTLSDEEAARRDAIARIESRRHFHGEVITLSVIMVFLVVIWATSEYHNAGGWPSHGFSQSSSIPNVWNMWILYPFFVWVLILATRAWRVYGQRPISEDDIAREVQRQRGAR